MKCVDFAGGIFHDSYEPCTGSSAASFNSANTAIHSAMASWIRRVQEHIPQQFMFHLSTRLNTVQNQLNGFSGEIRDEKKNRPGEAVSSE